MSDDLLTGPGPVAIPSDIDARLDALDKGSVSPVDLVSEFWSPAPGESMRCIYMGIEVRDLPDTHGELKPVEVAVFVARDPDTGRHVTRMNAGTQLVNACRDLAPNAMLLVTYVGEVASKSGGGKRYKKFSLQPIQA